jgi:hypothetical protein
MCSALLSQWVAELAAAAAAAPAQQLRQYCCYCCCRLQLLPLLFHRMWLLLKVPG